MRRTPPAEVRVYLWPEPSDAGQPATVAADDVAIERAREMFADGAERVRCHRTERGQADRKWTWTREEYERGLVK